MVTSGMLKNNTKVVFESGGGFSTSISGGGSFSVGVSGGGGGTSNYNQLTNKPSIEGVELKGNLTWEQLGLKVKDFSDLFVRCDTRYQFPSIGDKNHIYVDSSTGDLYMYGSNGAGTYVSIGMASGDVINGGSALS